MPMLPSSMEFESTPGTSDRRPQSGELFWDRSVCMEQLGCELDAELLHDVITTFIEDSRQRIKAIHDGLRSGKVLDLRRQAHSLKGSANQIGAKRMASLCKQIEQRDGELSSAQLLTLLDELDAVVLATTKAMLAYVNGRT